MGGLWFDSRAIQIGHSVAYGSPPLHRFSSVVRGCVGQAFSRGDEPRHSLLLLTKYAIIMKIFLKTFLRFLMTLERVNSVMILRIHKINFLRDKIALI